MALQITDANFEELVNSGKPMVLDFWAEWCGPCRMVGPIIDELATEYEGRVTIGKMDVDNNNDVVAQFGIRARNGEAMSNRGATPRAERRTRKRRGRCKW